MMAVRQAQGGPRDPYSPFPTLSRCFRFQDHLPGLTGKSQNGASSSHPLLPSSGLQRKQGTSDKTGLQVAATVHRHH